MEIRARKPPDAYRPTQSFVIVAKGGNFSLALTHGAMWALSQICFSALFLKFGPLPILAANIGHRHADIALLENELWASGKFNAFIALRSLQLGNHQRQIGGENPHIPFNRLNIIQPPSLTTVHDDPYLIIVVSSSAPDCFVHTWFYDGDYRVPQNTATTKRIFGLLAQLITIQISATDLSITPVVRVIH